MDASPRDSGSTGRRILVTGSLIAALAVLVALAFVLLRTNDDEVPDVAIGFSNNAVADGLASPDEAARLMAAAGGQVDRVQVDWAALEPSPGDLRLEPLDAVYEADLRQGVKPLFILAFAPPWATDEACATAPNPCHAAPAPEHFPDAARTAAALADRYPDAAGIEIWNEPNTPYFWAPRPDPVAYSRLLAESYRAIKRVEPQMPVVAGGTSSGVPANPAPGQIDAADFVTQMRMAGALDNLDALSVHAYAEQTDPTGESAVENVERVRAALGEETIPIWVTETGITTSGPDAASEEAQALAMLRLTELLPQVPGVTMVLIHTLVEPPRDALSPETGYGVVRGDLQPKQGYCALAEAWGGSGC